jgi:hypothetical protein
MHSIYKTCGGFETIRLHFVTPKAAVVADNLVIELAPKAGHSLKALETQ